MKKILAFTLSLLLACQTFSAFALPSQKLGDVDGDGQYTSSDALMILKYVVGIDTPNEQQFKIADINQNGKIETLDALKILKIVVGLEQAPDDSVVDSSSENSVIDSSSENSIVDSSSENSIVDSSSENSIVDSSSDIEINFPPIEKVNVKTVNFGDFDKSINNGEPIKGVDISSIISLEDAGVIFRDQNGKQQDIFKTLAEHGVNYIRVRVWNRPYSNDGTSYGGGNCDVNTAAEIGRRAAEYNIKLLVDFHYSDFWADPAKQRVPKDWENYSLEQKKTAIYDYTIQSLETIANSGAKIGMVQVGNETNCNFCGEKDMYKICEMFSSGCKAVKDFDPSVMRVLHFANPNKAENYEWYAKVLNECNVDYDVFATSYYPYWHGTLENLTNILTEIAYSYNKYVMVAETSYPYTNDDCDGFANSVSKDSDDVVFNYDISPQGQADCLSDVFQAVADVGEKGLGVFYWEPAWIGLNGLDHDKQTEIWEKHGNGWATQKAIEYDQSAKWAGGSSYDNQGLFDFYGRPLESLKVFENITANPNPNQNINYFDVQEGKYALKNKNSGLYLSCDDNGNVAQWGDKTYWDIKKQGDYYTLSYYGKNLVICDTDDNNASVQLWEDNSNTQQIKFIKNSDDTISIVFLKSGGKYCIDILNQSEYSGAWATYNTSNFKTFMASQKFELEQ